MNIFLLAISTLAFAGIISEKTTKGKMCFTIAFITCIVGAIICKAI